MQASEKETIEFYKKLEKEINNKFFSLTNTLSYMAKCMEVADLHLDQVTAIKQQSQEVLDCLDLPNKEDTAAIAVKKVEYEDRLDTMEDQMYELLMTVKQHKQDITKLAEEMACLSKDVKK